MFDHFIAPGTLRMTGLPFASTDVCSMTVVSESSPVHSRKIPIALLAAEVEAEV